MRLLISAVAHGLHHTTIDAAHPGIEPMLVHADGTTTLHGAEVDVTEVRPDIAWMTVDLWEGGTDAIRAFFIGALRGQVGWMQLSAAGTDNDVFQRLLANGTRLTTSHATAIPIAEYVLQAVLTHYQQPTLWTEARRTRTWAHREFREVHGTSWLVVGLGAIGTGVAVRARAFGANVVGCRRHPTGDEPVDAIVHPDDLHAALGAADVVVLAAPLTDETTGLVDAAFLARMRPGSVLVNVARGGFVDEDALLAALAAGVPEVAILDVTATEPLPADHPFWDHPQVVLTPHSSGTGSGRIARGTERFLANLARYVAGEVLIDEVVASGP